MRIGILTAGGDCPGLNAAIRGIGKVAICKYGMELIGFHGGFQGILENNYRSLTEENLSGILTLGGTILGTSRLKPYKKDQNSPLPSNKPELIIQNYHDLGLSCLVCIGGNGTVKTAAILQRDGLNIVAIPKTIDNDVYGTDLSFGFDSAVTIATEAIDRLHSTANSHRRIMVIELMGHHTGWIALYAGLASGGDVILIPEIPFDIKIVSRYLEKRAEEGKPYSIVVIAEGIEFPGNKPKEPKISAGEWVSREITSITGIETRCTVLGYVQRGGSPTPGDRILATRFGAHAAKCIAQKKFGVMVSYRQNKSDEIKLSETEGRIKTIPKDYPLLEKARGIGVCFGDRF